MTFFWSASVIDLKAPATRASSSFFSMKSLTSCLWSPLPNLPGATGFDGRLRLRLRLCPLLALLSRPRLCRQWRRPSSLRWRLRRRFRPPSSFSLSPFRRFLRLCRLGLALLPSLSLPLSSPEEEADEAEDSSSLSPPPLSSPLLFDLLLFRELAALFSELAALSAEGLRF